MKSAKDITLASVPRSTYADGKITASMGKYPWSAQFNVACWLRIEHGIRAPIELRLVFKDSRGWHQVHVDVGYINTHNQILLSGAVEIHALGPILKMNVNATGISSTMRLSAEELFVQRVEVSEQLKHSMAEAA